MADRGESRRWSLSRLWRLVLCVVAILGAAPFRNPAFGAQNNRSLIFVIDSSERMAPYLSSVKGAILTHSDQSKGGDYLGIITFSSTAKLLIMKRISGPSDRRSVENMLDAISAGGDDADIGRGVARALEEVGRLERRGDESVKGIIVISSSKSTDERQTGEILEKAVQSISKLVDEHDWYIQYCYLDGVRDRQIERLVSANHGFHYDVNTLRSEHGVETIAELYRITSAPEELCPMKVADLKGPAMGRKAAADEWTPLSMSAGIAEGTHIRVARESRAVIALGSVYKLGLDSEADLALLSARKNPLTGGATFHLALERGSIWMHLDTKARDTMKISSAGTVAELSGRVDAAVHSEEPGDVRVASFSDSLQVNVMGAAAEPLVLGTNESTSVGLGQMLEPAEPVEVRLIEEWKSWSKVLIAKARLASIDFAVPEVLFPEKTITLGPIKSGQAQSRTFHMQVNGVSDVSKMKMAADISFALPDGLSLSTGVIDGDEPGTKALLLNLDGSEGFDSRTGDTYRGLLKIGPAPDSKIAFEIIAIPLTITIKGPLVPPSVLFIVATAVLLGACAAVAIFVLRAKESVRPRPHRVIGRFVVINDPTKGRVGSINLEDISTKSSRLSLVVGRSRTVEVRLKHASVKSEHCTIEANLSGERLITYIEPIGSAKVIVNGETINSRTPVPDGAKIEIGDFSYQFEDTQSYKKVDVVYKNGRSISGVLDAVGMDAEAFRISPMDAVSPSERARIKFSDIRYVTFYRRAADMLSGTPRPLPKPSKIKRVELMFKKGNTISGYIRREYSEGRSRYVELLPLDADSHIDYTIVECSGGVDRKIL